MTSLWPYNKKEKSARQKKIKLLGIVLDRKLKFRIHIDGVVRKKNKNKNKKS
jgi:hypothetical protein